MEEQESSYIYTRNGVDLITPSIDLAMSRTDTEVWEIYEQQQDEEVPQP